MGRKVAERINRGPKKLGEQDPSGFFAEENAERLAIYAKVAVEQKKGKKVSNMDDWRKEFKTRWNVQMLWGVRVATQLSKKTGVKTGPRIIEAAKDQTKKRTGDSDR